jgi:hypothetical protein
MANGSLPGNPRRLAPTTGARYPLGRNRLFGNFAQDIRAARFSDRFDVATHNKAPGARAATGQLLRPL